MQFLVNSSKLFLAGSPWRLFARRLSCHVSSLWCGCFWPAEAILPRRNIGEDVKDAMVGLKAGYLVSIQYLWRDNDR